MPAYSVGVDPVSELLRCLTDSFNESYGALILGIVQFLIVKGGERNDGRFVNEF